MRSPPPSTDLDPDVRDLRHSSRQLVRVLGFLRGDVHGLKASPAQCHALLEVAARGRTTTGELAQVLEVDKSTASRTLGALQRRGLVEPVPDPEDQRTRPVRLTAAGRDRVAQLNAASDRQVRAALELLDAEQRRAVLHGVSLYEQALHRAQALEGVLVRPVRPADEEQLAVMLRAVLAEFGAVGAGTSSEDAELDAMHAAYAGPRSAYFVAERAGTLLAGCGIAPLPGDASGEVCELRKMHALPAARGLGIGRRLLERSLEAARAAGFRRCYLETLQHMHRACALYERAGFRHVEEALGNTGHFACNRRYLLEL